MKRADAADTQKLWPVWGGPCHDMDVPYQGASIRLEGGTYRALLDNGRVRYQWCPLTDAVKADARTFAAELRATWERNATRERAISDARGMDAVHTEALAHAIVKAECKAARDRQPLRETIARILDTLLTRRGKEDA